MSRYDELLSKLTQDWIDFIYDLSDWCDLYDITNPDLEYSGWTNEVFEASLYLPEEKSASCSYDKEGHLEYSGRFKQYVDELVKKWSSYPELKDVHFNENDLKDGLVYISGKVNDLSQTECVETYTPIQDKDIPVQPKLPGLENVYEDYSLEYRVKYDNNISTFTDYNEAYKFFDKQKHNNLINECALTIGAVDHLEQDLLTWKLYESKKTDDTHIIEDIDPEYVEDEITYSVNYTDIPNPKRKVVNSYEELFDTLSEAKECAYKLKAERNCYSLEINKLVNGRFVETLRCWELQKTGLWEEFDPQTNKPFNKPVQKPIWECDRDDIWWTGPNCAPNSIFSGIDVHDITKTIPGKCIRVDVDFDTRSNCMNGSCSITYGNEDAYNYLKKCFSDEEVDQIFEDCIRTAMQWLEKNDFFIGVSKEQYDNGYMLIPSHFSFTSWPWKKVPYREHSTTTTNEKLETQKNIIQKPFKKPVKENADLDEHEKYRAECIKNFQNITFPEDKDKSLRKWYKKEYPYEKDFWNRIAETTTFKTIFDLLQKHEDVYPYLANDSVVRESVFDELCDILDCEYDDIFYTWLETGKPISNKQSNKESLGNTPKEQVAKMDAWHNGKRKENIKACSDDKLKSFLIICKLKGYQKEVDEIEQELRSRETNESLTEGEQSSTTDEIITAETEWGNTLVLPDFEIDIIDLFSGYDGFTGKFNNWQDIDCDTIDYDPYYEEITIKGVYHYKGKDLHFNWTIAVPDGLGGDIAFGSSYFVDYFDYLCEESYETESGEEVDLNEYNFVWVKKDDERASNSKLGTDEDDGNFYYTDDDLKTYYENEPIECYIGYAPNSRYIKTWNDFAIWCDDPDDFKSRDVQDEIEECFEEYDWGDFDDLADSLPDSEYYNLYNPLTDEEIDEVEKIFWKTIPGGSLSDKNGENTPPISQDKALAILIDILSNYQSEAKKDKKNTNESLLSDGSYEYTKDEDEAKKEALSKYLGCSKDDLERDTYGDKYGDTLIVNTYSVNNGEHKGEEYLVLKGTDERNQATYDEIEETIDDCGGIEETFSSNFTKNILDNQYEYLDWDDIYDIAYEDCKGWEGDTPDESFIDSLTKDNLTEDELREKVLDYWIEGWGSNKDFLQYCYENNLVNLDEIVETCIADDGYGYFLSSWDGNEIELGDDFYAYRN